MSFVVHLVESTVGPGTYFQNYIPDYIDLNGRFSLGKGNVTYDGDELSVSGDLTAYSLKMDVTSASNRGYIELSQITPGAPPEYSGSALASNSALSFYSGYGASFVHRATSWQTDNNANYTSVIRDQLLLWDSLYPYRSLTLRSGLLAHLSASTYSGAALDLLSVGTASSTYASTVFRSDVTNSMGQWIHDGKKRINDDTLIFGTTYLYENLYVYTPSTSNLAYSGIEEESYLPSSSVVSNSQLSFYTGYGASFTHRTQRFKVDSVLDDVARVRHAFALRSDNWPYKFTNIYAGTLYNLDTSYKQAGAYINLWSILTASSGYSILDFSADYNYSRTYWIHSGSMTVNGNFTATSKSFDIKHPTKENMRLRYGSLEGPELGVYLRGRSESSVIDLPDYWTGLVDESTITVQLTAIGYPQSLYVHNTSNNKIVVGGVGGEYFYLIQAERKDVDKLLVEYIDSGDKVYDTINSQNRRSDGNYF